jgi:hypothetical protein
LVAHAVIEELRLVAIAEFEEKEYETAAALELAIDTGKFGPVFSSGQVLEKIVGYDAVADPWSGHRIWAILGVPRPSGIRLAPSFWLPGVQPPLTRLPHHPVSLVLQYKRPTYLRTSAAKQWPRWRRPYFRFEIVKEQQQVLRRLEDSTSDDVVVRYASPAFWQRGDLERNQCMRTILQSSGFVAPRVLSRHRYWTYDKPGAVGYPNPSGSGRIFETIETILFREPLQVPGQELELVDRFDDHLEYLSVAALRRNTSLARAVDAWTISLREAVLDLSPEMILRLRNFVAVQSAVIGVGAAWYMMDKNVADTGVTEQNLS